MNHKDEKEFIDFAKDHIERFNAIPLEFESSSGKVYGAMETWNTALKLELTKLINYPQ